MSKYRIIRSVNNANGGFVTYIIEKKILWWWSRNYLIGADGCYEFTDKDKAIDFRDMLNGKREWVTETVLD